MIHFQPCVNSACHFSVVISLGLGQFPLIHEQISSSQRCSRVLSGPVPFPSITNVTFQLSWPQTPVFLSYTQWNSELQLGSSSLHCGLETDSRQLTGVLGLLKRSPFILQESETFTAYCLVVWLSIPSLVYHYNWNQKLKI